VGDPGDFSMLIAQLVTSAKSLADVGSTPPESISEAATRTGSTSSSPIDSPSTPSTAFSTGPREDAVHLCVKSLTHVAAASILYQIMIGAPT
jgi:hypothetical protein